MPQEPNELTEHNRRYIDKATREFVELATRAVTKKSHTVLTLWSRFAFALVHVRR